LKKIETFRDVLIVEEGGNCIVSAVDSCGGIGEKINDTFYCETELVSELTLRVTVLEIMSLGAMPQFITVSVCNEPKVGNKIIAGFKPIFDEIGNIPFVISTEKNIPTVMTAIGISAVGSCSCKTLKLENFQKHDILCLAGTPLVGKEVIEDYDKMFKISDFKQLLRNEFVGSILPVGSGGVLQESEILKMESGFDIDFSDNCDINLTKSAGPASCALFSVRRDKIKTINIPFCQIGTLC